LKKLAGFWHLLRDYWQINLVKAIFTIVVTFVYVICYSNIALDHEVENGWKGYPSIQNLMKDISAFIPIAALLGAIHAAEVDLIMVFSEIYKNRREKRDLKMKEEGIAEGKAQERQLWSFFWSAFQEAAKPEAEAEEITPEEPPATPPTDSSK
jgi:hypothetical protein